MQMCGYKCKSILHRNAELCPSNDATYFSPCCCTIAILEHRTRTCLDNQITAYESGVWSSHISSPQVYTSLVTASPRPTFGSGRIGIVARMRWIIMTVQPTSANSVVRVISNVYDKSQSKKEMKPTRSCLSGYRMMMMVPQLGHFAYGQPGTIFENGGNLRQSKIIEKRQFSREKLGHHLPAGCSTLSCSCNIAILEHRLLYTSSFPKNYRSA